MVALRNILILFTFRSSLGGRRRDFIGVHHDHDRGGGRRDDDHDHDHDASRAALEAQVQRRRKTTATTDQQILSSNGSGIRGKILQRLFIDDGDHEVEQEAALERIQTASSSPRKGWMPRDNDDDSTRKIATAVARSSSSFQESSVVPRGTASMWPPWPFNLLSRGSLSPSQDGRRFAEPAPRRPPSLFWAFLQQSAQAGLLNLQYMTSQLMFHLPPAAPPFIVLACIPRHRNLVQQMASQPAEQAARRLFVPLISDPFARNIVLSCLGLAVMSWAHSQAHRLNRLAALPLPPEYQDIQRAVLPPFLPEEEAHEYLEAVTTALLEEEEAGEDSSGLLALNKSLPFLWNPFWDGTGSGGNKPPSRRSGLQGTVREWRQLRRSRVRERHNAHRITVMDQLIAIQALKKSAERKRKKNQRSMFRATSSNSSGGSQSSGSGRDESRRPLGYAVVTGASRGIGRAIAVELSRWGVPLVLVARDIDRLTSLAFDIEACYGVDCCVLQADLSKPGVAAGVYQSVREAGLPVDILVNNAGYSSQGVSVDLPMKDVDDMLSLNVNAVTTLTQLFGKDMKDQRRGRILMVSSVNGAVSGIPTVSVYSATKAFEKTLATSLAREMEPFGVGVTCLLPGAVRDTEFRSRSNSDQALCWKIPFYAKTPPQVAEHGVRSLLLGQSEVTPGWMNRVFLKFLQPVIPSRVHSIVAETIWNPLRLPFSRQRASGEVEMILDPLLPSAVPPNNPHTSSTRLRYKISSAPRLLKLEENDDPPAKNPEEAGTDALAVETPEPASNITSIPSSTGATSFETTKLDNSGTTKPGNSGTAPDRDDPRPPSRDALRNEAPSDVRSGYASR